MHLPNAGVDREALEAIVPKNLVVANGGLVPPALQGHTPDIALRFDPHLARRYLTRAAPIGQLAIAALDEWEPVLRELVDGWQRVLGLTVNVRTMDH